MSRGNVLGIDVAKDTLVIYDRLTNDAITIANTVKAIEQAQTEYGWNSDSYLIGLESTSNYSFLPMQYFVRKGFEVRLLNPIVTKKFTKATVRAKKTDRSDAETIAMITEHGEGNLITENDLKIAKKTLLRLEGKIIDMRSDLKRMKKALDIKIGNGIELDEAVKQIDKLIIAATKASEKIWQLSREEEVDRQEKIIASHIGCGEKLSAIISTEAGDLKRFPDAKQFKAYAGIDPRIYQSGEKNVKGKMTKRGNSNLRCALYLAAFVASQHDPELSVYYKKKREEGKSHRHAICTVSRKLCERIYSTVINNRLYEPRYPENILT
jgi:transposase